MYIYIGGGGDRIRIWARLSTFLNDICRGFLQPFHENSMIVVSDMHDALISISPPLLFSLWLYSPVWTLAAFSIS
jgi:hypothetical protein